MNLRNSIYASLAIVSIVSAHADTNITYGDVAKKVTESNFVVLNNALQVYQAKENIRVARGALLPHLNVWEILKVAVDPTSIIDLIEDITPFLVPANWFRLKETELIYFAETEGYRALWANELMTAKRLYLQVLVDREMLRSIEQSKTHLDRIYQILKAKEEAGAIPIGTSRPVQVRRLAYEEDGRNLGLLVSDEINELASALGIVGPSVNPMPVTLPNPEIAEPLKYSDYEFRAIENAPEIKQLEHFLNVIPWIKNEILFSFLGMSATARGVSGGIFDNIPVPEGLGFGTAPSLRIAEAQQRRLEIQKTAAQEVVKRHLKAVVTRYNVSGSSHSNFRQRLNLSQATLDRFYSLIQLGNNVPVDEFLDACDGLLVAKIGQMATAYKFMMVSDGFERILFYGDYSKQPSIIGDLQ